MAYVPPHKRNQQPPQPEPQQKHILMESVKSKTFFTADGSEPSPRDRDIYQGLKTIKLIKMLVNEAICCEDQPYQPLDELYPDLLIEALILIALIDEKNFQRNEELHFTFKKRKVELAAIRGALLHDAANCFKLEVLMLLFHEVDEPVPSDKPEFKVADYFVPSDCGFFGDRLIKLCHFSSKSEAWQQFKSVMMERSNLEKAIQRAYDMLNLKKVETNQQLLQLRPLRIRTPFLLQDHCEPLPSSKTERPDVKCIPQNEPEKIPDEPVFAYDPSAVAASDANYAERIEQLQLQLQQRRFSREQHTMVVYHADTSLSLRNLVLMFNFSRVAFILEVLSERKRFGEAREALLELFKNKFFSDEELCNEENLYLKFDTWKKISYCKAKVIRPEDPNTNPESIARRLEEVLRTKRFRSEVVSVRFRVAAGRHPGSNHRQVASQWKTLRHMYGYRDLLEKLSSHVGDLQLTEAPDPIYFFQSLLRYVKLHNVIKSLEDQSNRLNAFREKYPDIDEIPTRAIEILDQFL